MFFRYVIDLTRMLFSRVLFKSYVIPHNHPYYFEIRHVFDLPHYLFFLAFHITKMVSFGVFMDYPPLYLNLQRWEKKSTL